MFKRIITWFLNLFRKKEKKEEKVQKEIPSSQSVSQAGEVEEEQKVTTETTIEEIAEYSPDIFEVEEEDLSLFEEEKDLERQIRELKRTKEEMQTAEQILDQLSSGGDIFESLGNDQFWNATEYCSTIRGKFRKAKELDDEESQLKHFWRSNKMYMRAVEAYRDAIANNDMLRARVMLLNIRLLYDVLITMHQLSPQTIPKPQTLDIEMRKEYVKDILVEILEKSRFPLSIKQILEEVKKGEQELILELLKEESIQFYIQSLVEDEFIKEIQRVIDYAPPPLASIPQSVREKIPEIIFEYAYAPDIKMYRREDIGREELSALFPPDIYKGLQTKGFYRIEDVYGKIDELEKVLLEELNFEPDMTTISMGIIRERIGRLEKQKALTTEAKEKSLLQKRKQRRSSDTTTKAKKPAKETIVKEEEEKTPRKDLEFLKIPHQDLINSPIPRPYQLEAYYMFKGNDYNGCIIDSPTGSGKTLMGMLCIQDWLRKLLKNEAILVLVPTQNYQSQWVDSICFNEIGLKISPNFVFSGTVSQLENFIEKTQEIPPIIVLTYTSLAQILGADTKKEKELKALLNWLGIRNVIFDEAHKIVEQEGNATNEVAKRMVKFFKGAHIENLIGFSGTAKAYEKNFRRLGLKLIYIVPEKELVLHGFVAPFAELGVTFAYSGREKAIRKLHNELKVNLKQFWTLVGDNKLRQAFQKIPMNERIFIVKELLGMYQSYNNEATIRKLKAKFKEWAPAKDKDPLNLNDTNLIQAVHIYYSWSDKSLVNQAKHPTAAKEIIEDTERIVARLEQLIRIPRLKRMIRSDKYGKRLPRRKTFYEIRKKYKKNREVIKEVREIMCATMVGIYKTLDAWARTKIGEGRIGTLKSIITAEEEIRDVKGVVIFDRGQRIKIEDETGIASPGFSGVGGSFAQSLGTNILNYNPIAVQSSEMYISYNPDLEKPLHVMMADFIREEVIIDKLSERIFMEIITDLPFNEQLTDYLYPQFKRHIEDYVITLKKVYRARYSEFSKEVFQPLIDFIHEMKVLDPQLDEAITKLTKRIDEPSIRINNIILTLFDYATIARKIEYAKKGTLQAASGELQTYYYLRMPSGRKKQLIYDLVSDFLDSEELPIQLVFVSSWARTGWDVRTPDILIDATATRDVTAWQQLRGRAMRALETWTTDCYRTISTLLGTSASADKIISRLPSKMQAEFERIRKDFSKKETLSPSMIELLQNSIDETKLSSEERINLKNKVSLGEVDQLSIMERMKLIIYLLLSKNKVAHVFEMVKASGSTSQVELDKKSGMWRRKSSIAKKHRKEPILPVPGSVRHRGKYVAPLIYAKDPTMDTPKEIRDTLKGILHGMDEDLLDDWVLNLIKENESRQLAQKAGITQEREELESFIQENKEIAQSVEIDGVTEDVLEEFLSEIDSIEF
ncbi:MAG: DEAD/DEAH box helicase [Candidatus Heimdallarchaeota archaeon]|nr:DEAD/DEAH box helicase [Candidatus Heimdallarchaeota archaeon]